ncbi:MAG TPA: hypothetical protein VMZ30_16840 [Pyrinomonadaceae bacterium]|nr:hypothetical protein [Pyrinomonadaceae bacterium]
MKRIIYLTERGNRKSDASYRAGSCLHLNELDLAGALPEVHGRYYLLHVRVARPQSTIDDFNR